MHSTDRHRTGWDEVTAPEQSRAGAPDPDDDQTIVRALRILRARLQHREVFSCLSEVKHFLRLQAQGLAHEVFAVMYLDTRNRLIAYERLFRGSLTQTPVYPREVVKQALARNAAAVILHHNHPSGACEPGPSDHAITRTLKTALALVDVRVLDHVITSDEAAVSMAEQGMI